MIARNRERVALLAFVAAGLAYRLVYVVDQIGWLNGDNAVVALMVRHILEGHAYVFFWGQPYMGTLEPYSIALVAAVAGLDDFVLRAVPLAWGMAYALALYGFTRVTFGPRIGLAALALVAFCPPFLALWSSGPRGGYVESLFLGQAVLGLAVVIARDRPTNWGTGRAILLGSLAGLAVWTNPLSVSYLLTAGIVLLVADPAILRRPHAAAAALAMAAGSAPFWAYNLFSGFESRRIVAVAPDLATVREALGSLVVEQAPVLAGLRDVFGAHAWILPPFGFAAAVVLASGLAWGVFSRPRESWPCVVLGVAVVGVYLPSAYASLETERYLLPLYSAAIPILAAAGCDLAARSRLAAAAAALAVAAVAATGAVNVHRELLAPGRDPNLPAVIDFMVENGIRQGYADHGEALVNTYRSGERVVLLDRQIGRYPVRELPAWTPDSILERGDGARLAAALDALGCRYRKQRFPYYSLFYEIRPRRAPEPALAREGWTVRVDRAPEEATHALDGDSATRWATRAPQAPGMQLELDLGSARLVSGLALDAGPFVHDSPRGLRVEVREASGSWRTVADVPGTVPGLEMRDGFVRLGPGSVVEVRFAPVATQEIRVVQTGRSDRFDWSVAELYVFGAAEVASRARTTRATAGAMASAMSE